MIKAAPWSFTIVCLVTIAGCFGGFRLYYHSKLEDSETRGQHWKDDADYWKDLATHPPRVVTGSPPGMSVPATHNPVRTVERKTQEPSPRNTITGSSKYGVVTAQPGGVVSIEQQGGVTAGQVTINPSVDFVEPSASIKSALSLSLAALRVKYSDRDIAVWVAPEAGNPQRRRVSQFLGKLLAESNLGIFSDGVYVGAFPDHPVTAVCTSADTDIANDLLDALAAYMPKGAIAINQGAKLVNGRDHGTMYLYVYGSPTFRQDGYLVFK